jgi:catechol 2,3-dioxygenase-like lactoylglutathione lyase family enzyme
LVRATGAELSRRDAVKVLWIVVIALGLAAAVAAEGEESMADKPLVRIGFIYNCTNSLEDTRRFYTELLGMEESAYKPEWNYLCYRFGDLEFMFFGAEGVLDVPAEFADQPGWEGGTLEVTSWSVEVPEADFGKTVERLRAAGVKVFNDKPEWRVDSYWGYTVLDPNGVTVEVYTIPKQRPSSEEWTD